MRLKGKVRPFVVSGESYKHRRNREPNIQSPAFIQEMERRTEREKPFCPSKALGRKEVNCVTLHENPPDMVKKQKLAPRGSHGIGTSPH
jgi:hypothetical protein